MLGVLPRSRLELTGCLSVTGAARRPRGGAGRGVTRSVLGASLGQDPLSLMPTLRANVPEVVLRVAHVVVTTNFAGTERYVCDVARLSAAYGHDVVVVGGDRSRMPVELGSSVPWHPAGDLGAAVLALRRLPRPDVVHAHLTSADTAAALITCLRGSLFVSTRHIAARRGSSAAGRLIAPVLRRRVDHQIAISDFVAAAVDGTSTVLRNGVPVQEARAALAGRTVLVCQRLEREKETAVALRGFAMSGLQHAGWRLLIAGRGAERGELEGLALRLGLQHAVEFLGFVDDVRALMLEADVLLATAPAEPLGLTVLEAMALGLPVVAAAGGGHLETVATVPGSMLVPPSDAPACSSALLALAGDRQAARGYGGRSQDEQRRSFDIRDHVRAVLSEYGR